VFAGLLFDSYEAHWQRRGWIFVVEAAAAAAHAVDRWNNRGPGNAMSHMLQFREEEADMRDAPIAQSATELHTHRYHQGHHPGHNIDTDVDVVDDDDVAAAAVDDNCS